MEGHVQYVLLYWIHSSVRSDHLILNELTDCFIDGVEKLRRKGLDLGTRWFLDWNDTGGEWGRWRNHIHFQAMNQYISHDLELVIGLILNLQAFTSSSTPSWTIEYSHAQLYKPHLRSKFLVLHQSFKHTSSCLWGRFLKLSAPATMVCDIELQSIDWCLFSTSVATISKWGVGSGITDNFMNNQFWDEAEIDLTCCCQPVCSRSIFRKVRLQRSEYRTPSKQHISADFVVV